MTVNQSNLFIRETLDAERHDVQGFDCGNEVLNHYLKEVARREQAHGIAQTHVILYQNELVGFYTAKCTKIRVDYSEANMVYGRSDLVHVPAIDIPYLGVDVRFQGQGFGNKVLVEIVGTAYEVAKQVGCRYVFLRALNVEWLIRWYERNHCAPFYSYILEHTCVYEGGRSREQQTGRGLCCKRRTGKTTIGRDTKTANT